MTGNRSLAGRELVLLPSLRAQRSENGNLILTQKYLNGVALYADLWQGKVTSLVYIDQKPTSDMDRIEILPEKNDVPIEIRSSDDAEQANRLRNVSVVLCFLSPYELQTAKLCHEIGIPLVFSSEYSPKTEKQIVDSNTSNPLLRIRRKLWIDWAERKRIEALNLASGIQCSGTPTYEIYRRYHSNALLFFDNRVSKADVISEQELVSKLKDLKSSKPLRLVYGGRLINMKGVLELPKVAARLKQAEIPFSLSIFGSGELESKLQNEIVRLNLEDEVKLCGVLDFETQWIPMLKKQADLFICCHTQGDPSSTYPEVMSCGVPIIGYDNEAFNGIVNYSKSGWLSPMNDYTSLADIIVHLSRFRSEIVDSAYKARKFALANAFEPTFKARTDQLIEASRELYR